MDASMREGADRREAVARAAFAAPANVYPPHVAVRLEEGDARPAGVGVQLGVNVAAPVRRHAYSIPPTVAVATAAAEIPLFFTNISVL